jgi:hypothetical protein
VKSEFEKELQRLFHFTTLRQKPQAKLAESRQRIAQDEFFSQLQWYVGNNIQSTKQSGKQNPDVRKANSPHQCVTTEQVISKWNEYRDFKCNERHPKNRKKTRLEYFLENIQPQCPVLDELAMVQIFAHHLGCVTTVAERRFELQVKDRIYKLPVDLLSREDIRKKVSADGLYKVKYLPHDTNKIYLYNPTTEVFICEVYEKPTAQRAKVEQTEEDKLIIGDGNAELKRLQRQHEAHKAMYESLVADFESQIQAHSPVRKWTTVSPQSETAFTLSTEQNTGLYDGEEPSYEYVND